jgi:hypothetical protein
MHRSRSIVFPPPALAWNVFPWNCRPGRPLWISVDWKFTGDHFRSRMGLRKLSMFGCSAAVLYSLRSSRLDGFRWTEFQLRDVHVGICRVTL